MYKHGAVAIVASAGGIPALIELLRHLPNTFPLPIFVAQHLPRCASKLDAILSSRSSLKAVWAAEGDRPYGGCVYLVPPTMRLAITATGLQLSTLPPQSLS